MLLLLSRFSRVQLCVKLQGGPSSLLTHIFLQTNKLYHPILSPQA